MGKPCFSKLTKFFALAVLAAATAIAAIAVLSSPATAKETAGGGGGFGTLKPWDTDNLKIGSTYSARSFAVPHYGSQGDPARNGVRNGGTENHSPCQPCRPHSPDK